MGNHSLPPTPSVDKLVLLELQALRLELRELHALFHDFATEFLSAKFPHGRPVDRFARRFPGGDR